MLPIAGGTLGRLSSPSVLEVMEGTPPVKPEPRALSRSPSFYTKLALALCLQLHIDIPIYNSRYVRHISFLFYGMAWAYYHCILFLSFLLSSFSLNRRCELRERRVKYTSTLDSLAFYSKKLHVVLFLRVGTVHCNCRWPRWIVKLRLNSLARRCKAKG